MPRGIAVLLTALLLAGAPASAQDKPPAETLDEAGRLALEAAEKMLEALKTLIERLPQYEAPEFNENGDIVIRRKPRAAEPPAGKAPPKSSDKPLKTTL